MKKIILYTISIVSLSIITYGDSLNPKAPDFTLPDLKGSGQISLSEQKGKIVLLFVWTSWCSVCRKQMPLMSELKRDFEAKGFEIIGISIDDTPEQASRYIMNLESQNGKLNFPVLYDRDKQVTKDYMTSGVPNNFVIGRDGSLLRAIRGGFTALNIDSLREILIESFEKSKTEANILIKKDDFDAIQKNKYETGKLLKIDENKFIVSGGLIDKKILSHFFKMTAGKINDCHIKWKNENPLSRGTISVRFIIGENGKVSDTVVEQNYTGNEKKGDCIKSVINKLTFPPPKGGPATIRYTFEFE